MSPSLIVLKIFLLKSASLTVKATLALASCALNVKALGSLYKAIAPSPLISSGFNR